MPSLVLKTFSTLWFPCPSRKYLIKFKFVDLPTRASPMAPTILTGPFNVCISRRASSLTVNLPFSSSNLSSGFAGELQQVLLKRETNIKRTSNFKIISTETTSNFEDVQFQWVKRPMTRTKLQVRRVWYFVIIMREIYMRFCINVLCPSVSVSLLILLNDESIIWEKPPNVFLYFAASWCTKAQSIHRKWLIWKENFGNRTLGDSIKSLRDPLILHVRLWKAFHFRKDISFNFRDKFYSIRNKNNTLIFNLSQGV